MTTLLGIDEDWSKAGTLPSWCRFVIGYVSQDITGKNITRAQVDAAHAQGAAVGLVFEYAPQSALGGTAAGTRDAGIAIQVARALGTPPRVALYAAVDFQATTVQLPTLLAYALAFQGACEVAGFRSGIYADYLVCVFLAQHGYTGFLWQTYAWSGQPPQWWAGDALRQTLNGITVAGATVDKDEAEVDDWGQWEADMGLTDRQNQILEDLHSLRNWAISPPTVTADQAAHNITPQSATGGVPVPNSLLANLDALARGAVHLDDASVTALATALAGHPAPGTGSDPAAIEQALRDILPAIRLSAA